MKKINKDLLGWMVAATLAGILASSGFQANSDVSAVCDLQKVVKTSDLYKTEEAKFKAEVESRRELLKFIDSNRVIAADEWVTLRNLWTKPNPSDTEKADLAKVKQKITDNSTKLVALQKQATHTPDDAAVMEDFQNRTAKTKDALQALDGEMSRDMAALQDGAAKKVEDEARAAVQAIGKEQGYAIVFDMLAAPYGSHDITDATLARMNKK